MQSRPEKPATSLTNDCLAYFGGSDIFNHSSDKQNDKLRSIYLKAMNTDPVSITQMARHYEQNGQLELAARWYFLLASLNIPGNQVSTSLCPSSRAVIKIHELLKRSNHPNLLTLIGLCHAKGYGVPDDYAVAKTFFERGATLKDGSALFHLGFMTLCSPCDRQTQLSAATQLAEAAVILFSDNNGNLTLLRQQLIDFPLIADILKNIVLSVPLYCLQLLTFLYSTNKCYSASLNTDQLVLAEQKALTNHADTRLAYIDKIYSILTDVRDPAKRAAIAADDSVAAYLQGSDEPSAQHLVSYLHFHVYTHAYFERIKASLLYLKNEEVSAWKSYQQLNPLSRFFSSRHTWLTTVHTELTNLTGTSTREQIFKAYEKILSCLPVVTPEHEVRFYAQCLNSLATITLFGHLPPLMQLDAYNQSEISPEQEPPPTFGPNANIMGQPVPTDPPPTFYNASP